MSNILAMRYLFILLILVALSCRKKSSDDQHMVSYKVKYEITSSDPTSVIQVKFTKQDGGDSTANPGIIPALVDVPWSYQGNFSFNQLAANPPNRSVGFTVLENQAGLLTEKIFVNDSLVTQAVGSTTSSLIGVRLSYNLK